MNINSHARSGFTLVEVLVSITLLLMVIVGPLQILTRTNNSTQFATEQMTAWFLAQEGLELAQQGRDSYLLRYFEDSTAMPNPWQKFASTTSQGDIYKKCFSSASGCGLTVDTLGLTTVTDCTAGTGCKLYLASSGRNRYQYSSAGGASTTPFTRVITMKVSGNEVVATSTVTWRTGSLIASQKVVTATSLFNIYDTP